MGVSEGFHCVPERELFVVFIKTFSQKASHKVFIKNLHKTTGMKGF